MLARFTVSNALEMSFLIRWYFYLTIDSSLAFDIAAQRNFNKEYRTFVGPQVRRSTFIEHVIKAVQLSKTNQATRRLLNSVSCDVRAHFISLCGIICTLVVHLLIVVSKAFICTGYLRLQTN